MDLWKNKPAWFKGGAASVLIIIIVFLTDLMFELQPLKRVVAVLIWYPFGKAIIAVSYAVNLLCRCNAGYYIVTGLDAGSSCPPALLSTVFVMAVFLLAAAYFLIGALIVAAAKSIREKLRKKKRH